MFNRLRAFAQTVTVLDLAMIILIWCSVVFLSGAERDHVREAGLEQGNNLTRIFEAYISQVVKGADSALLALRDSYERNPRDFDLMRSVDNARSQNDLVVRFAIIGPEEIMRHSTLASSGPPIDLSDRDYFRYHASATTDELFISLAPDAFIPLAEETGLINPLGECVLRKACNDAVKWPPQIKVAVNLSLAQFQGGGLVKSFPTP